MKFSSSYKAIFSMAALAASPCESYTVRYTNRASPYSARSAETTSTTMIMMSAEDAPNPTSFREAEVLGLRLMQEGNFDEALVGTSLVGSYYFGGHGPYLVSCIFSTVVSFIVLVLELTLLVFCYFLPLRILPPSPYII
jgi:hypothetical protein